MKLIIVESPTKAKTISKFLGAGWEALSSYGHIRDLPQKKFGIDIEKDFEPQYTIVPKAKKNLDALKKAVKKADEIIISTDPDREGEAIAWHLTYALGLKKEDSYQRIVFHEITKTAIEEAMKNPRKIDMNLVDAQQARRILDRIVGYKLSPFLWKKIVKGLSAGRVQSVATRLVCDREKEIKKFIPQEYWTIIASLFKKQPNSKNNKNLFDALLVKKDGKTISKLDIKNKTEADEILNSLKNAEYKVSSVENKETKKNPLPPFTTSTLQQEAWKKFRSPAKMTMSLAQQLYENGYITYHRTDSLNLSESALAQAKDFITKKLGQNYWAGEYKRFKAKGLVQEAHEAIRPSSPSLDPEQLKKGEKLNSSQAKLYELIWQRFIASQMSQAIFNSSVVEIKALSQKSEYIFRSTGQTLKFDGFLKIYPAKIEETLLPALEKGDNLVLEKIKPEQHFTQPPARYNEASLIKVLEENGIGRPSTYAPTLNTIQVRNYIEKDENKRFKPTEIGEMVNDLLTEHFPQIVDMKFTAKMEEDLDKIAGSEKKWVEVLKDFYNPFAENLKAKYDEVAKAKVAESATDKICPKCGSPIIIKMGRFGKFYACSNFPECKHTESLKDNNLHIKCPKCGKGDIIKKMSKRRKPFYGCSKWPDCDFAAWDEPINEFCPECKSILVKTKKEIKCSSKECGYKKEEAESKTKKQ